MADLSTKFVNGYRVRYNEGDCPIFDSYNGLGYVVYKRSYARPLEDGTGNTEEWPDTLERVVNGAVKVGADLNEREAEALYDHMYNLRGFVAGRMLWQLGTRNNERLGGDSLVNCWWVSLQQPEDFGFLFEELMLGGGVGFDTTKSQLFGTIRPGGSTHIDGFDADFIVPDNREGWSQLLVRTIKAHQNGDRFTYSTDAIRPEGAPIATFGGKASGPGILVEGIEKINAVMGERIGQSLRPIDVLDIGNIIGSIVVSGNVRRSAQIAIGPADDQEYLDAKNWALGTVPQHRAMSNNSVYVDDPSTLPASFWLGYEGDGEAYGLVNLGSLRTYGRYGELNVDYSIEGVNPCAEIGLADYESCNLSEIVLPHIESPEQLTEVALLLYKVNKAITGMPYLYPETEKIVHKNRRIGISVTGVAQAEGKLEWLSGTYEAIRAADIELSEAAGIPESIRLTTVKPSGTLSLVAGVTPGGHPGFSRFHIRRVRMSASDALVNWARGRGYPVEFQRDFEGNEDPRTVVVSFPAEMPEGTVFADDVSAIDQLDMVRFLQREWADNAVSITVYFAPEELPEIREYLAEHWDSIKTVSFLLKENHGYQQAPLEAMSEDEYRTMQSDLAEFRQAHGNSSEDLDDAACATGACPIR